MEYLVQEESIAGVTRPFLGAVLPLVFALSFIGLPVPATANGVWVTQGIRVVSGPAGNIATLGLAFMDQFRHADRCLSTGEAAAQATVESGAAAGLLGAVIGGVLGAAATGDVKAAGKTAAAGAMLGGAAGAAGGNRVAGQVLAASRDLERRRTIDLCHLVETAQQLAAPVWMDIAARAGEACSIDPARIFRGDANVDNLVINQCIRRDPRLTSQVRERVALIRAINQSTCRAGQYIVAEYDRQLLLLAHRGGGSFMPTVVPSCSGSSLSNEYRWLL